MKKILLTGIQVCLILYFSAAQIIYTDINPDKVLNQLTFGSDDYMLDMNNDGITDYQITNTYAVVGDTTYSKSYIFSDSLNEVAVDASNFPVALTEDSMINNSLDYQSTNLGVLKEITSVFGANFQFSGNWLDGNNRYLGVRFKDHGVKKYGWVLMEMDANQATVITNIRGYAYDTSGAGIIAGDSSSVTGFNDISNINYLSIVPYGTTAIIKYTGTSAEPMHITVTDMLGREMKDILSREQEVHLDLSSSSGKICLITAQKGNEAVQRKVLVL